MDPPRRVVTGLAADGRSRILFDGPSETVIWRTPDNPADNSGVDDAGGGKFTFPKSGSLFGCVDLQPGSASRMHATDTIDYIVIAAGEITFVTEAGETVVRAGDLIVDRGVLHAWRNHTDAVCRLVIVFCPSEPVGDGARWL